MHGSSTADNCRLTRKAVPCVVVQITELIKLCTAPYRDSVVFVVKSYKTYTKINLIIKDFYDLQPKEILMPTMSPSVIDLFLISFSAWFFLIFGIVGIATGIGLIFNQAYMHKIFGVMNQWISMRRVTRWLAIPHDSGPSAQRFRHPIGVLFIIAAAFSTFFLITQINVFTIAATFGAEHSNKLVVWIIECIHWFLITGNIVAIAVGIMLVLFPNVLHTIETHANQWYSIRKHSQGGDTMHMSFDNWVESNPRAIGWIITIGAFIVVINFGILLFANNLN